MTRYNKKLKLKFIEQYFAGKSATTLSKENKISKKIIGLLPTCTCGGDNEIQWVQQ